MSTDRGLVCAWRLDGSGGGSEIGWDGVEGGDAPLWIHLDRTAADARHWLTSESGLDPLAVAALLAEETRPRATELGGGVLVTLRGVNFNAGAEPEDMISIRMWTDGRRVISTRRFRLRAVEDLRAQLHAGRGPADAAGIVVAIVEALAARMDDVILGLGEQLDELENRLLEGEYRDIRHELTVLRRRAITLKRYLAPQREATGALVTAHAAWFAERQRLVLRETSDRNLRYVEELDAVREHAAVVQEELANRLSEHMNRTMYLLTMVATIMLPLGVLTGLLGINVGGIPGTGNPTAFYVVCAVLLGLVSVEVVLFRRLRWL